jgi:aryl-alcohol dehydrogenase-like predicted oxidoreductase
MSGATPEGTQRYAGRFSSRAAAGHFRTQQGFLLSSIGIGTYLGEPNDATDRSYADAIVAAVEGGVNVLDSAINYRFQRSERAIRAALEELARRGYPREEVVICTKGGFLTPDGDMPTDVADYFQRTYVAPGLIRAEDVAAGCHVLAPRFIADQIERSRKNLGVDTIDVYYLHNPETQLGEYPPEEFEKRLHAAFEFLETAVTDGKIRFYGLATWNGFRQPESARDSLSLAKIDILARSLAGEGHHCRFVQLPYNLGMTEALTRANQAIDERKLPMIEAAHALGITLVASASLLQGQVARNLPPFIAEALGLENDAERALQFVRSTPGISSALVGMSHLNHVRANLRLVGIAPAPQDVFTKLFDRRAPAP